MMGRESVLDLPVLARLSTSAGAEPHNILCVVGEMVAWQCAPKE
jgi:hypothetical protein